jgi:alpha-N-arabinofuranosidase
MSRFPGQDKLDWEHGPRLIEDEYTVQDAVVVGNLLMSLLRHSDRVAIACQAQLVNVIAPIRAEPDTNAWRQTIYYPFALTARHARGQVLRVEPITPQLHSRTIGDVPAADVVATRDPETQHVAIFAVNRKQNEIGQLNLRLQLDHDVEVIEHVVIGGVDLVETNSAADPGRITPRSSTRHTVDGAALRVELAPQSWSMIRLAPGADLA